MHLARTSAAAHKTMRDVCAVDLVSSDCSGVIAECKGALKEPRARAGNVECRERAVGSAHKTVKRGRVKISPGDRSSRVDTDGVGALEYACAFTGRVKRCQRAVRGADESVVQGGGIKVGPDDGRRSVHAQRVRTLTVLPPRVWRIERRQSAVRSANETVMSIGGVKVRSSDCSRRIDARYDAQTYTRTVEAGEVPSGARTNPCRTKFASA